MKSLKGSACKLLEIRVTPQGNMNKSDLKAMYDRLAECPVVDESIFNVTDAEIDKYNHEHSDEINSLLQHVDILFDSNNDNNDNIKIFLDTLMDKIKLADDNEIKYMNTYKTLLIDKNKSMSRKLGLEENIEKTNSLIKSKQDECREIRNNTKKKIEDMKTEKDNERMKTEDARVTYLNQTLSLTSGLEEEENHLKSKLLENDDLKNKYKDFEESIQARQEGFANQIRHKELEIQLLRARAQQEEQFIDQTKRKQAAYDDSISQHLNSENERLEKIELYKTYLSSSSSEQGVTNIKNQFEQRKVEIREAISKLEVLSYHHSLF